MMHRYRVHLLTVGNQSGLQTEHLSARARLQALALVKASAEDPKGPCHLLFRVLPVP
jgi:hypothetical protein